MQELLKNLVNIPSISGNELQLARFLQQVLAQMGYQVKLHRIDDGSVNLYAYVQPEPPLLLSTHLDTVPPFLPARIEGDVLYGRGACDAKGIIASMIEAVRGLRPDYRNRVGFLFLAREETDSAGAAHALVSGIRARYIINGEPTENKLARAQKGSLRFNLVARGRAAHSGYPELGKSAIDLLVRQLSLLQTVDWGKHPVFGDGTLNIGRIEGGIAANVIPPEAHAVGNVRVATSTQDVESRLRQHLLEDVECEVFFKSEPLELFVPEGFASVVVKYGSDATYLAQMGRVLMLGPGSIHWAHTEHEQIRFEEMRQAVEVYRSLIEVLLNQES